MNRTPASLEVNIRSHKIRNSLNMILTKYKPININNSINTFPITDSIKTLRTKKKSNEFTKKLVNPMHDVSWQTASDSFKRPHVKFIFEIEVKATLHREFNRIEK